MDESLSPDADPQKMLPPARMPFNGDFSGAAWNGQALLATHSGKQNAKMRQAFRLARSHDLAIFEETHSNIGKSLAARIPSDLQAFWSHGSNYQAGVSIFIKRAFL